MMNMIDTVRGAVKAESLSYILPHEHIAFYQEKQNEQSRKLVEQDIIPTYRQMIEKYQCNTIVEVTPRRVTDGICVHKITPGEDRIDLQLYQEISEKTGMNIVVATGYYVEASRPEDFFSKSVSQLAQEMIDDITRGIAGRGIKAGIIKVALDSLELSGDKKLLEAAAIAQKETGKSITTHTCTPEIRLDTLNFLEKRGVNPARIYLGHADANSSIQEAIMLARRGCNLLYTIWGITNPKLIGWKGGQVPRYFSSYLVKALVDEGYLDQVLVSIDYNTNVLENKLKRDVYEIEERSSMYAFTFLKPSLERIGLTEEEIKHIMKENPRNMLL